MQKELYKMKDVMDKYNISRDFIKYYEKKGLISPIRNEAKYRLYDEIELQKIKRIVDLRELGFSMEEIEMQMLVATADTAIKHVDALREKIETEIISLNKKLEKINSYEKWIISSCMFSKQFKIDTDYRICCGCKHITPELCRNYYVRDLQVVYLTEDIKINSYEEKNAVILNQAEKIDDACKVCKENRCISFPKVYRGAYRTNNIDEIEVFFQSVYEKANSLGYKLQKVVYCTKRNTNIGGVDGIALDICIPFEE